MAINFPNSPTTGQLYTFNDTTWQWSGEYWNVYSAQTGYITSVSNAGNGFPVIDSVTSNALTLKSFSGTNMTITDSGGQLNFYVPLNGGGGGQLYYFNISQTQTPYLELATSATTGGEQSITSAVTSGNTATIGQFLTPSGYPGVSILPGGVWSFYLHTYKQNSSASFDIYCDVYKRTSGGTETLLFSTDPVTVLSNSPTPIMVVSDAYYSGATLNTSDRILVNVRARNTSNNTYSITFVSEGAQHYSYVSSPLLLRTTDIYVDSFTYTPSANTVTIGQTESYPPQSITINSFSGLSITSGLTANTLSILTNLKVVDTGGSNETVTIQPSAGGISSPGRNQYLPDGNGTYTLSINGVSAGDDGDISLGLNDITSNNGTTNNSITFNGCDALVGQPSAGGVLELNSSGGLYSARLYSTNISSSAKNIEFPNNNGTLVMTVNGFTANTSGEVTIPVSSGDYLPLSGGTVTGGTIFQSGVTATTATITTLTSTYANLDYIRDDGGTVAIELFSSARQLKGTNGSTTKFDWETMQFPTLTNNGYLKVSGGTGNIYVDTSSPSSSGDYLPLSGGTVTGGTIFQSGLTANTISATTYENVNAVTGGSYSNGVIILSGTGNVNGNQISGFTKYVVSATTPSSTFLNGDRWFDTTNGIEFVYINDGDSSQWIQPNAFISSTILGTLSATTINSSTINSTTISATTYQNLPGSSASNCISTLYVSNISGCSPVTILTPINITQGINITGETSFASFTGSSSTISGTKGTVITSGSSTTALMTFSGSNTLGGANYNDFIRVTNTAVGATNPNKTIRLNNTGGIEFLNNAYTAVTLSLSDNGILSVGGGNSASVTSNDATTNYLSFNSNSTQIYDDGNTHIHARGNGNSMWVNTNNAVIFLGNQSPIAGGGAASAIIMGSGSTTTKAFANIYGGKTYTIGAYGYLATIGAGTGAGTTATYGLYSDNRIEAVEFDATSDERLKDIQGEIELGDAIKLVNNLKPIKFTWKDKESEGIKVGYSAQQVVKSGFNHLIGHIKNEDLPETTDNEGFTSPEGFQLTMNYDQVTPYHGVVIKHLLDKIEQMEKEIKDLKNKI